MPPFDPTCQPEKDTGEGGKGCESKRNRMPAGRVSSRHTGVEGKNPFEKILF